MVFTREWCRAGPLICARVCVPALLYPQPRSVSVTYVLGTICLPCLWAGQFNNGGESGIRKLTALMAAVSCRLQVAADAKDATAAADHCPLLPAEPSRVIRIPAAPFTTVAADAVAAMPLL